MCVLVGEHQPKPVVGSANELRSGWRRSGDVNRVVTQRSCPAGSRVGLIRENYLGEWGRNGAKGLAHLRPNVLGDRRQPDRECLLALMKMNREVRRTQRSKAQHRIEWGCEGAPKSGGQQKP